MKQFLIALAIFALGSVLGPRHHYRHDGPTYLEDFLSGQPSEGTTIYFTAGLAILIALLIWAMRPQIYRLALWWEARDRRPGAD